MDSHGIEVFNRANDNAVIFAVPHHLHLILFPANQRFVDKQFIRWGQVKATLTDGLKLITIVSNTSTGTAHRKGRPNDAGEAEVTQHFKGLIHGVHC